MSATSYHKKYIKGEFKDFGDTNGESNRVLLVRSRV